MGSIGSRITLGIKHLKNSDKLKKKLRLTNKHQPIIKQCLRDMGIRKLETAGKHSSSSHNKSTLEGDGRKEVEESPEKVVVQYLEDIYGKDIDSSQADIYLRTLSQVELRS